MELFENLDNSKFSSYTSYILFMEMDLFLITAFSAEASSEFIVKKKKGLSTFRTAFCFAASSQTRSASCYNGASLMLCWTSHYFWTRVALSRNTEIFLEHWNFFFTLLFFWHTNSHVTWGTCAPLQIWWLRLHTTVLSLAKPTQTYHGFKSVADCQTCCQPDWVHGSLFPTPHPFPVSLNKHLFL